MCFSYLLHFEPRYRADSTTAIWEGRIHEKVVFINTQTFYYTPVSVNCTKEADTKLHALWYVWPWELNYLYTAPRNT